MGISGNLKTMVLAELLQWLSMGQKTGTLVIDNRKVTKRIFFENGMIISSASTDPKEYLGRFLASHGFIPEDTVNEAVARQIAEKQLIGKILVNMGAISEEDLHQMLLLKAEESIYDIFTWEEADFEFLDDVLPSETMIRMQLDVQGLVLEGTRRVDEWERIRDLIPTPLHVPVSVVDFDSIEDIDEIERQILAWVDDDRTVEEISQEAQISLFQVASAFAQQVPYGRLKMVRPRIIEVKVEVPAPEAPAQPQAPPMQAIPQQQPMMAYPQAPNPVPQQAPYAHPPPSYSPSGSGVPVGESGRPLHYAVPDGGSAAPAPPPPASEAEELVRTAEGALKSGDLVTALKSFRKAKTAPGSNSMIEAAVRNGESMIQQALEREGVGMESVPKLKCGMDELTKLEISPQEGFMLTRVDGSYNLKSILKMSPMPPLDAQMLFWRLKASGHVLL